MDALLRRRAMIAAGGATPTPPPPGVVFYDRLVFDGTAYIETDLYLPTNGSITANFGNESVKAAQSVFGQAGTQVGMAVGIYLGPSTSSTSRSFIPRYQNNNGTQVMALNFSYATYNLFLTPNKMGIGTQSGNITKGSLTFASGLYIGKPFGSITRAFTGRVGEVRIYDSTVQNITSYANFASYTPTYTLRPCTYNGESGLWCVETSTFYGNSAGAGSLSVLNNS